MTVSETGAQDKLVVSQPGSDQVPVGGELVNTGKLLLKNDTPIDLSIRAGAGNTELNLSDLNLNTLKIESGAGTTNINLNGDWNHAVTASIKGGIGELTVKLPSAGTSPYTLTLKLEAGVGSVTSTTTQQ